MSKGKQKKRTVSVARTTYDPEKVSFAHRLFVIHRLTFAQIARMMQRRFGLGTRIKTLAATISRWANADPVETADGREIGLWFSERENRIREEIALEDDSERLVRKLVGMMDKFVPRLEAMLDNEKSKVSPNLINAFVRGVKNLYAIMSDRREKAIRDVIISGDAEVDLLIAAIEDVIGPAEFTKLLPEIVRAYRGKHEQYEVKLNEKLLNAMTPNVQSSRESRASA